MSRKLFVILLAFLTIPFISPAQIYNSYTAPRNQFGTNTETGTRATAVPVFSQQLPSEANLPVTMRKDPPPSQSPEGKFTGSTGTVSNANDPGKKDQTPLGNGYILLILAGCYGLMRNRKKFAHVKKSS